MVTMKANRLVVAMMSMVTHSVATTVAISNVTVLTEMPLVQFVQMTQLKVTEYSVLAVVVEDIATVVG